MFRYQRFLIFIQNFCTQYPAVLSGYVIYSYLFLSIIRLFLKVKTGFVSVGDVYDIFSALPFMWLLALSLVKVIEVRSRLHESERRRLQDQQELRIKEMQLATMKEVVLGLQHQINNPLAIISLSAGRITRVVGDSQAVTDLAREIRIANKRIATTLNEFSDAMTYEVENGSSLVGNIASPMRDTKRAMQIS